MPGPGATLFALPALKKRDYPVVLVRDEATSKSLPAELGCYTFFDLGDDGAIREVHVVCEEEVLRRILAQTIPGWQGLGAADWQHGAAAQRNCCESR